jgi:hypothetical protein
LLGRGIFGSGWQRQNLAQSLAKLDSDELDDMALSSRWGSEVIKDTTPFAGTEEAAAAAASVRVGLPPFKVALLEMDLGIESTGWWCRRPAAADHWASS